MAQLGARFHGMEEVVSSNLTRSTNSNTYRLQAQPDSPTGSVSDPPSNSLAAVAVVPTAAVPRCTLYRETETRSILPYTCKPVIALLVPSVTGVRAANVTPGRAISSRLQRVETQS